MPPIPIHAPDDEVLLDAIAFSRRMGNYLFLPLFIVFGFCTLFILLAPQDRWEHMLRSTIFIIYAGFAVVGFVFWRFSRKPRARLLLAEALLLAVFDLIWVVWLIHVIVSGHWLDVLHRISYAMAVLIGIGGASLKCFQLWSILRRVDTATLEVALRGLIERDRAFSKTGLQ